MSHAPASARAAIAALIFLALPPGDVRAQTRPLGAATPRDFAAGKHLFDAQCAVCHGTDGSGGTGPSLQRTMLRKASTDRDLVDVVRFGLPGTEMPSFALSLTDRMAWQTAAYVRSLGRVAPRAVRGNAAHGASVYDSSGCTGCHVVSGRGGVVGPDLTAVGALRGPGYLRESLIEPAATHPPGYLVVRAIKPDGAEIRGIRLNEDVFWVHIRDVAGVVHTMQKSDLSQLAREPKDTLMPSYGSRLSTTDLDDLVAYLASLRGER